MTSGGSNRGFAWKRLWTVWKDDLTPLQMLFGLGGDAANARLNIDDYSVKYMMLLNGDVFDSAHNEYLQHLICGGGSWADFLAGLSGITCPPRTADSAGACRSNPWVCSTGIFQHQHAGRTASGVCAGGALRKAAAAGCPRVVSQPFGIGNGCPCRYCCWRQSKSFAVMAE